MCVTHMSILGLSTPWSFVTCTLASLGRGLCVNCHLLKIEGSLNNGYSKKSLRIILIMCLLSRIIVGFSTRTYDIQQQVLGSVIVASVGSISWNGPSVLSESAFTLIIFMPILYQWSFLIRSDLVVGCRVHSLVRSRLTFLLWKCAQYVSARNASQ